MAGSNPRVWVHLTASASESTALAAHQDAELQIWLHCSLFNAWSAWHMLPVACCTCQMWLFCQLTAKGLSLLSRAFAVNALGLCGCSVQASCVLLVVFRLSARVWRARACFARVLWTRHYHSCKLSFLNLSVLTCAVPQRESMQFAWRRQHDPERGKRA